MLFAYFFGRCFVLFIISKSLVAPVKSLTTPRMELSAAVIAVHLAKFVQRGLDVCFTSVVFWSDLTTVIKYLRITSKSRTIFEINRIKLILELSSVTQWRWVETASNPADAFSGGASPYVINKPEEWIKGRLFLLATEETLTFGGDVPGVEGSGDLSNEVHVRLNFSASVEILKLKGGALGRVTDRFSDLRHAVLVTAWILRLRRQLHYRVTGKKKDLISETDYIGAREYDLAFLKLIALNQRQKFSGY